MKTTEEEFELFQAECDRFVDIFGLKGWDVHYDWTDLRPKKALAVCLVSDPEDRLVVFQFTTKYTKEDYPIDASRLAFHEVWELFLSKITDLADRRYIRHDEIREEAHNIIITMENVVYPLFALGGFTGEEERCETESPEA